MRRRKRRYYKSKLVLRQKARPVGQTEFNVELRLLPHTFAAGNPSYLTTSADYERFKETGELLETLRTIIGGRYKVIKSKGTLIRTKILLERENDLIMLMMAHPTMMCRAYKFV